MLRKIVLVVKEENKSLRTNFVTFCAHEAHTSVGDLLSCAIASCPNHSWKNAVVDLDRGTPNILASDDISRSDGYGGAYVRMKGPIEQVNYCFKLSVPSVENQR